MWWLLAKREIWLYSATEDLAKTWPAVLAAQGVNVNQNKGWAKNSTHFLGYPHGHVSSGRRWVDMGAELVDDENAQRRRWPSSGYYITVVFVRRNLEFAATVGDILVQNGAVLCPAACRGTTWKRD